LNPFLEQIKQFYTGLEPRQQRVLWVAVALSVILMTAVGIWAARDSYNTVLVTRDAEELRNATTALDEELIPYRVDSDGQTLQVPSQMMGPARISIAATGTTVGLELLEEIGPGTTPRRELWMYQRALQGELTRTLVALDEIEACRVHLVLPERSAFLKGDKDGSASVALRLASGRSLSENQVRGITSLVAGAISGLDPAQVVLTDEKGNMLTRPNNGDQDAVTGGDLLEMRKHHEQMRQRAVERALTDILGSMDQFNASIAVEVDSATTESVVRSVDPNSQVPLSEQLIEEQSSNANTGGVPGTESNLPENATPKTGETQRSSTQTITNYKYTETETHTVQAAGRVNRITAGVVVNADRVAELVAASEGSLSEESIRQELHATIKNAIGFDEARGDELQLSFLPFAAVADGEETLAEASVDFVRYLPYSAVLLALLLVFVFVVRPLMAQLKSPALEAEGEDGLESEEGAPGEETFDDQTLAEKLRNMVDNFQPVDARELNRLVEARPECSTQVLRRWIKSA